MHTPKWGWDFLGYDTQISVNELAGLTSVGRSLFAFPPTPAEDRTAAGEMGYANGIGMMLAEKRMAANEKGGGNGYANGIGAMSAKDRTAAGEKGGKDNKKAQYRPEGKFHVEKNFQDYFKQRPSHYDPKISQFLLSEDKVVFTLSFCRHMSNCALI